MKENDKLYLQHILESIEKIERLIKDIDDVQLFASDEAVYNATLYLLATIGEAVTSLSDDFKVQYRDIPWQSIKDMRNILIHEYLNVSATIVWKTLCDRLPELKTVVKDALV